MILLYCINWMSCQEPPKSPDFSFVEHLKYSWFRSYPPVQNSTPNQYPWEIWIISLWNWIHLNRKNKWAYYKNRITPESTIPLPFIVTIDIFKLKTSLAADELWSSLTDQLKTGKDKFVWTTCLTQKSTWLDSKKSKRAQNETHLFLWWLYRTWL